MGVTLPQQFNNAQALQGQMAALPAPQIGPIDLSGGGGPPAIPAPSLMPTAQPNQVMTAQQKYNDAVNSKPGVATIHNPFLRGLAEAGDIASQVAGSVFLPAAGIAAAIPGTTFHHERQVNIAANNLAQAQNQAQQQAQTDNLNLQPQLRQQAAQLAQEKQTNTEQHQNAVLTQQRQLQLARNGQMEVTGPDGQTHIVDDPDSQVFQSRKILGDYHTAQIGLDQAKAELAQAGNDPASPAYKLAVAKVQTAAANASAAGQRAQAYMLNAQSGAFGTYNGQPLPGALLTDSGQPIGSHFSANVRPTGQERGRADLGESAQQQIGDMKEILTRRSDLFGPGAGHVTDFNTWVGSQDPDAQRFRAAAQTAADHLAGVFGGRSEAALDHIYSVIGKNTTNPAAAIAGLNQIESTLPGFIKKGTPRTVGSNAAQPGGQNPPNGSNSQAPPRPLGVPADAVFNANGPRGAGWYPPPRK